MLRKLLLLVAMAMYLPWASAALIGSGSVEYGFGYAQLPDAQGEPVVTTVSVVLSGATEHAELSNEGFAVGSPDFTTTFLSGATFDALVQILTNGQDDSLSWFMTNYAGGVSSGTLESFFFAGSTNLLNGIDFAGSTIDRIDFSIFNESASPGDDPNGDGVWTDWNFRIAMDVYGPTSIPEPASAVLALVALGGLTSVRRRAVS